MTMEIIGEKNDSANQQHEITPGTVVLLVSPARVDETLHPCQVPLLRIPYNVILLYSTKPRKWLLYCDRAICGVDGHLRSAATDISQEDMDDGVKPDDHYVYHLHGDPNYVDKTLNDRPTSWDSWSDRSHTIPDAFEAYYGGCPFTKTVIVACKVHHLIEHANDDDYYRNIIASRNGREAPINVGEKQNILVMSANIHILSLRAKTVAFLKTPNSILKTNELPGADQATPDDYRVTVHCFSEDMVYRRSANHGTSSDLRRGCGLRRPLSTSLPDDNSYRPNDTILDLFYALALLEAWGENRVGDEEKVLRERKRKERIAARAARHSARNAESEEEPYDTWDFLLDLNYLLRGTSRAEVEAKQKGQEERESQERNHYTDEWRKGVVVTSGPPRSPNVMDCNDEFAGDGPKTSIIDGEETVRVDEVLNRSPLR
ncbi:uncharacterized protein FOMMEDRAFT_143292 [Fomitiporia mediterranea MF3/22]|uniref:uncharacterized protein n=1 Tax=Fomitiporia mediterranea (strain MF3/22) TaxID=694068 RepID=UPI00044087DF|nr:uncharacterized protein FOMMEDRAFT_143292 [Fomitiporia mediterranea MF3/22]EJC98179.1 hypothetical protein FOMMEDRAFT_143292 [Fomitiporia mediterranea MF3/22]